LILCPIMFPESTRTFYKGAGDTVVNSAASDDNSLIAGFGEGDKNSVAFDSQTIFIICLVRNLRLESMLRIRPEQPEMTVLQWLPHTTIGMKP